jgi:hypothetical protein
LLLSVHLFNTAGYTFLFRYLNQETTHEISRQIDSKSYDDNELVELKIALNLPYQSSMSDYELHSGEITLNGSHHNYVKRKISGDTLYLLCLPNREKDKLQLAETNFSKDANGFDGTGKKESQVKKSQVFNQFQPALEDYTLSTPSLQIIEHKMIFGDALMFPFLASPGKPPKVNS